MIPALENERRGGVSLSDVSRIVTQYSVNFDQSPVELVGQQFPQAQKALLSRLFNNDMMYLERWLSANGKLDIMSDQCKSNLQHVARELNYNFPTYICKFFSGSDNFATPPNPSDFLRQNGGNGATNPTRIEEEYTSRTGIPTPLQEGAGGLRSSILEATSSTSSRVVNRFSQLLGTSAHICSQLIQSGLAVGLGLAAGALTAFKIAGFLAVTHTGIVSSLLIVAGGVVPVAAGALAAFAVCKGVQEVAKWWLRKNIISPFLGFNPQMAFDDPAAMQKKLFDTIQIVAKWLKQEDKGRMAQAYIEEMFPSEMLKDTPSREAGTEILVQTSPKLIDLMTVVDSDPDNKHLVSRYTIGDQIFKTVFGPRVSADKELSRYLGEVINMTVDVCRLALNRGNLDRNDYTNKVMGLISNTVQSLVTQAKIDFIEKTVAYRFGGFNLFGGIAKWTAIGAGLGLFGMSVFGA